MTCPRCHGLIICNHDEWYCPACSHRPYQYQVLDKCMWATCSRKPKLGFLYCYLHQNLRMPLKDRKRMPRHQ